VDILHFVDQLLRQQLAEFRRGRSCNVCIGKAAPTFGKSKKIWTGEATMLAWKWRQGCMKQ